jgi:hypothetical protein
MANTRAEAAGSDQPTPEQFLAAFPVDIRALAEQLRALIRRTVPNVDEAIYSGWRLIGYRVRDSQRTRYFCYIAPFADRVTLGFEYGVLLSNDAGLLEGMGTQARYVTIRELRDIREMKLAALIAEAASVAATLKRRGYPYATSILRFGSGFRRCHRTQRW